MSDREDADLDGSRGVAEAILFGCWGKNTIAFVEIDRLSDQSESRTDGYANW